MLTTIAIVSIIIAIICAIIILIDVIRKPQHMPIMNIVWAITPLYSGPLGLLAYYKIGKKSAGKMMNHDMKGMNMKENDMKGMNMSSKEMTHHQMPQKPFWQSVLVGCLHCGSGCTLGDFASEFFLIAVPVTLFSSNLYGGWLINFCFAFIIGIVFQYYAIKPMKNLSPKEGIIAALKADTLSLTFWQIGMYGWMAICMFVIFHQKLEISNPVFWLMMQIAMLIGFCTAYPMNWWLLKKGIKEVM